MKIKEKKQVKAIQDNKQLVNINKDDYKDDYKVKLLLSKKRETFKDIDNKRLDKIEEWNNRIDYDNLEYAVYSRKELINFYELKSPLTVLDEIKKGEITLEEAKNYQKDYLDYLKIIRKGNKSVEQRKTLANHKMFYNARKE